MDALQTAALFQASYINYARNSRAIAVLLFDSFLWFDFDFDFKFDFKFDL